MPFSTGMSMNFCKFLETLKTEINSFYHLKIMQKPFPTGEHCFWKYCQANSFNDFHVILGRPPVSKMKLLEKYHWHCSTLFSVSRFYCCSGHVSDGWDDPSKLDTWWYFCQNNAKHKLSIQCTYRRRQWGLRICQCYFKISNSTVSS